MIIVLQFRADIQLSRLRIIRTFSSDLSLEWTQENFYCDVMSGHLGIQTTTLISNCQICLCYFYRGYWGIGETRTQWMSTGWVQGEYRVSTGWVLGEYRGSTGGVQGSGRRLMFNMRRMKALGIGYLAQKLTQDFFSQLDLRRSQLWLPEPHICLLCWGWETSGQWHSGRATL